MKSTIRIVWHRLAFGMIFLSAVYSLSAQSIYFVRINGLQTQSAIQEQTKLRFSPGNILLENETENRDTIPLQVLRFISFSDFSSQVNEEQGKYIVTDDGTVDLGNDSLITLVVQDYRGEVVWQKTTGFDQWTAIGNGGSVVVSTTEAAIYRAMITEGTCEPVYSDSAQIVFPNLVAENIIYPDQLGFQLISNENDLANGKFIYSGVTNSDAFEVGYILIDERADGQMGIISKVSQNGTTVTVETSEASMEDLFIDATFKLSTAFLTPEIDLKSLSIYEIEKALTDENGYIHPVEAIFLDENGALLKSRSVFTANQTSEEKFHIYKSWAGTELYNFSGSFTSDDGEGPHTYSGSVSAAITEGYLSFQPDFIFEFDYVLPGFEDFQFRSGKINHFKFYTDRSKLEFKNIITQTSNIAYEYSKDWTLVPDLVKAEYKFLVGGVPVFIAVNVNLDCSVSAKIEGESSIQYGFTNTNYLTIGAEYKQGAWSVLKDLQKEVKVESGQDGKVGAELQFDLYPKLQLKLYSIVGPSFSVGPYLSFGKKVSLAENYHTSIDCGINSTLAVEAKMLGKTLINYEAGSWKFFDTNLFYSPAQLQLISGDQQKAEKGKYLPEPVMVQVLNSWNQPVSDVNVYFEASNGSSVLQPLLKTNANGVVQNNWKMSSKKGVHNLKVYIKNGDDQIIEGKELLLTAESTEEQQKVELPKVTTASVTNILKNSASGGGTVTADGGAEVTDRGICWSISANPTIGNSHSQNGTGLGAFTSTITGLEDEKKYYVRAYATNSEGTSYGNQVSFETEKEQDNQQTVSTVTIGNQLWTAENISGLYTWEEAQSVCPAGWRVPTNQEWDTMLKFVGESIGSPFVSERWVSVGSALKAKSGWAENGNGSDLFGFKALPSGWITENDELIEQGQYAFWWSSSPTKANAYGAYTYYTGKAYGVYYGNSIVYELDKYIAEKHGVRCIKNK